MSVFPFDARSMYTYMCSKQQNKTKENVNKKKKKERTTQQPEIKR